MMAVANEPSSKRKFAVLLLAHGTPETLDQIPEYLNNVVSGRPIPPHVLTEIRKRYAQIGKSPLTEWTLREATLLEEQIHLPVYVGMRNWRPYIADTVRAMKADGITDAVAICMAPQNSRTSVGLYRRAAYAEAGHDLHLHFVSAWADHPRLIDAFAERLRATWNPVCRESGAKVPVVFTAHSVPLRTVQPDTHTTSPSTRDSSAQANVPAITIRPTAPERSYALPASEATSGPDPYAAQAKQTASLVAERLSLDGLEQQDWHFAFQSQGASGGPWLGPTVEETLAALHEKGHSAMVLQPVGFLCDHIEILYDIDIAFQQRARQLGIKLVRTESLNDSPSLIDALADLASQGIDHLQAPSPDPVPAVASATK